MASSPYLLLVASQKGGVGKSAVAVNLAASLAAMDFDVLLIDADTINPSVGFYLGLEDANIGYGDVLKDTVALNKAIVKHASTGMQVLPGIPYSEPFLPNAAEIDQLMTMLKTFKYDFIIKDTPPGYYVEDSGMVGNMSLGQLYDMALITTTPDMTSTTAAIRMSKNYEKQGMRNNLVINRARNRKYELDVEEIEEAYGKRVMGVLQEDDIVPRSASVHIPAVVLDPRAPFSMEMGAIARMIGAQAKGKMERPEVMANEMTAKRGGGGILRAIMRFFGRR